MFRHHKETVDKVIVKMRDDESVLALIIAGSIVHGFAGEDADVDIMIVVSQEEYEERCRNNETQYLDYEICTYEKGYVDGKYISEDFIKEVVNHGGEPARFAFKDAYIAYSKIPGLEKIIGEATRYPVKYKEARMRRFYARFLEWCWFYYEGINKNNAYLLSTAVCNIVLYGGRAILACNELLYPYHKWFLKILESAGKKPENIMPLIYAALETRSQESVACFIKAIKEFRDWGIPDPEWPRFLGEDVGCSESEL